MAKVRSPNYPQLSLGEAIKRIKVVFDKNHQRPESREVIAKSLGYVSLNGTSLGVISALSKYGLLEAVGDSFRVSRDAQDILMHYTGEPERLHAVRKAAFLPTLFSELHDEYGDRIPGEHSLEVYLLKRGFNPNTVPGVMRVYRDTMEFVNAETQGSDTDSVDESEDEASMQTQTTSQSRPLAATALGSAGGSGTVTMANDPRMRAIQLPYSFTEWATLQAAFPLSEDEWEQMLTVLNAMKRVLVAPPEKQEQQSRPPEPATPMTPPEPASA